MAAHWDKADLPVFASALSAPVTRYRRPLCSLPSPRHLASLATNLAPVNVGQQNPRPLANVKTFKSLRLFLADGLRGYAIDDLLEAEKRCQSRQKNPEGELQRDGAGGQPGGNQEVCEEECEPVDPDTAATATRHATAKPQPIRVVDRVWYYFHDEEWFGSRNSALSRRGTWDETYWRLFVDAFQTDCAAPVGVHEFGTQTRKESLLDDVSFDSDDMWAESSGDEEEFNRRAQSLMVQIQAMEEQLASSKKPAPALSAANGQAQLLSSGDVPTDKDGFAQSDIDEAIRQSMESEDHANTKPSTIKTQNSAGLRGGHQPKSVSMQRPGAKADNSAALATAQFAASNLGISPAMRNFINYQGKKDRGILREIRHERDFEVFSKVLAEYQNAVDEGLAQDHVLELRVYFRTFRSVQDACAWYKPIHIQLAFLQSGSVPRRVEWPVETERDQKREIDEDSAEET